MLLVWVPVRQHNNTSTHQHINTSTQQHNNTTTQQHIHDIECFSSSRLHLHLIRWSTMNIKKQSLARLHCCYFVFSWCVFLVPNEWISTALIKFVIPWYTNSMHYYYTARSRVVVNSHQDSTLSLNGTFCYGLTIGPSYPDTTSSYPMLCHVCFVVILTAGQHRWAVWTNCHSYEASMTGTSSIHQLFVAHSPIRDICRWLF